MFVVAAGFVGLMLGTLMFDDWFAIASIVVLSAFLGILDIRHKSK
ncbi:MAG: hypothetical protein OXN15_02075 [Chloroflexota bacterium]|nr:hypothetical protein [Chloroflexota bacterium]